MHTIWLALPGFIIWLAIIILPWRSWSTRESLDAHKSHKTESVDLSQLTVLIPARNEADVITSTLSGLEQQGQGLNIIIVDDQSTDGTAQEALNLKLENLKIIMGSPLPEEWTGKLWALEQGRQHITTPLTLLLDADIELLPGTLAALVDKMKNENLHLVSLMAFLRMESLWEKFLMPAFIYFFKLLYPFHLANSRSKVIAAAAGGCILIQTQTLSEIGGFTRLKDALIDDCTLARHVKDKGYGTWLGLTHSAISKRRYDNVDTIWDMVARTAFTQLRYSPILLIICSLLLLAAFVLPILSLIIHDSNAIILSLISLLFMAASYIPTLKYYSLNPCWSLSLPGAGLLYLCMTWSSAIRHWQGRGAHWKARHYSKQSG